MPQPIERTREVTRLRKARYGKDCLDCGKRTDGSNGPAAAPDYCTRCWNARQVIWTREVIILAIQTFVARYGTPPTAEDWNSHQSRARGRADLADRFTRDGDYPATNVVQYHFDSWNAAIEAAGYEPRPVGHRGPGRPRVV